jgi:hypothetical protein
MCLSIIIYLYDIILAKLHLHSAYLTVVYHVLSQGGMTYMLSTTYYLE